MASTQKVTGTLRAAGFKAAKTVRVHEEGRIYNAITEGYKVFKTGRLVGVECCHCMDQKDAIAKALKAAGLTVTDLGNGILTV